MKRVKLQDGTIAEVPDDATDAELKSIGALPEGSAPPTRLEEGRGRGILSDIDAAVRGAADVLTFGTIDELAAMLSSATGIGGEKDDYEQNLSRQRAIDRYDEENNPWARTAGQVAGGVAGAIATPGAILPSTRAVTNTGAVLAGAGEGAVAGGLYGIGSSEQAGLARLQDAPAQAAVGAGFGAAGALAAPLVRRAGTAITNRLTGGAPPPDPTGIPLTRGQATGDIPTQQIEQEMLANTRGPGAQSVMQGFLERQRQSVEDAARRIGQEVGGAPMDASPTELGEQVLHGIRGAATRSRREIDAAYNAARGAQAVAPVDVATRAPLVIRQALETVDSPLVIEPKTTPVANQMLSELDEFGRLGGVLTNRAQATMRGPNDDIVGVTLDGIEAMRSRLSAGVNTAEGSDRRAASLLLRAYDDYIEQAGEAGLLQGDDEGLALWQKARQMRAQHGRRFESNPRQADNDAGKVMEKWISKAATGDEVVRDLVGISRVGEKGVSTRLARRLQNVLPPEDMARVRQLAWQKLITNDQDEILSPERLVSNLGRALDGRAQGYIGTLFTEEQRAAMRTLRNRVARTRYDPQALNNPKSGFTMARAMQGVMRVMGPAGGAVLGQQTTGGIGGAIAGATAGIAAEGVRLTWNKAAAKALTRPGRPPSNVPLPSMRQVRPGAAYGGASALEDEELRNYLRVSPGVR